MFTIQLSAIRLIPRTHNTHWYQWRNHHVDKCQLSEWDKFMVFVSTDRSSSSFQNGKHEETEINKQNNTLEITLSDKIEYQTVVWGLELWNITHRYVECISYVLLFLLFITLVTFHSFTSHMYVLLFLFTSSPKVQCNAKTESSLKIGSMKSNRINVIWTRANIEF